MIISTARKRSSVSVRRDVESIEDSRAQGTFSISKVIHAISHGPVRVSELL